MDSKQLRIGNFVNNDAWGGVSQIEAGDLLAMAQCEVAGKQAEFITPIDITERWLKDLGFETITISNVRGLEWNYWGKELDASVDYEVSTGLFFYRVFETKRRANIHYVHQLQNLYFALTGTELVLSGAAKV